MTWDQHTVLLVEDDALSLKLMRDVLQSRGHAVLEAGSGLDALALVQDGSPNLIVMDIGLPGLNGVEVTRRLKADPACGRIPILAVSAYAMPDDEERMREAGCDAFMSKPLRFADFIVEVERLLEAPPVRR